MSGYPHGAPFRESRTTYAQARQIMGCNGTICQDRQGTIWNWSWHEDAVRTVMGEPDDFQWFARVLALQGQGWASLCLYAAPVSYAEDGSEVLYDPWQDEPLEEWGQIDITSTGVLALAATYGR